MSLFDSLGPLPDSPLPERFRPTREDELLGQPEAQRWLKTFRAGRALFSLILWGPPGSGKTTMARMLAHQFKGPKIECNAIQTGSKEIREIGENAKSHRRAFNEKTLVFLDEIHRLNKGQQDLFLPYVESGDILLIGATTENPSYSLNAALLSRCQLVVFGRLDEKIMGDLLDRTWQRLGLPKESVLKPELKSLLIQVSDGDARKLLRDIEIITNSSEFITEGVIRDQEMLETLLKSSVGYDRAGDQHYDLISAFIKSIRGSDADAALYYFARMIKGGEDPRFIGRRLIILASEDVGNADPRALSVAVAAFQAFEIIGVPEGLINLSHAVTYLASAPKSNRSYMGWNKAQQLVERTGSRPVPLSLRSSKNIPMVKLGYGQGYEYPHDFEKGFAAQDYWPEGIGEKLYEPTSHGFEKNIREYRAWQQDKKDPAK